MIRAMQVAGSAVIGYAVAHYLGGQGLGPLLSVGAGVVVGGLLYIGVRSVKV